MAKLLVIQVCVVNHLRASQAPSRPNSKLFAEILERAVFASVPEATALEHVESNGFRKPARIRIENEFCVANR